MAPPTRTAPTWDALPQPERRLPAARPGFAPGPAIGRELQSLSEELLVRMLSYMDANDLSIVARINNEWNRLAQEPMVWKRLYLSTFDSRVFQAAEASIAPCTTLQPWRQLYKTAANWRRGLVVSSTLSRSPKLPFPVAGEGMLDHDDDNPSHDVRDNLGDAGQTREKEINRLTGELRRRHGNETRIELAGDFVFVASSRPLPSKYHPRSTTNQAVDVPRVEVFRASKAGNDWVGSVGSQAVTASYAERPFLLHRPKTELSITEIRVDTALAPSSTVQGGQQIRLAVFYSTGQFTIHLLTVPTSPGSSGFIDQELGSVLGTSASVALEGVTMARYHHPILVTSSAALVQFYEICTTTGARGNEQWEIRGCRTKLRSETSCSPSALTLVPLNSPLLDPSSDSGSPRLDQTRLYKATFVYSTPLFPGQWTIGAQEFTLRLAPPSLPPSSSSSSSLPISKLLSRMTVTTRAALNRPITQVPHSFPPRFRIHPRAASPILALGIDGSWIVGAKSDNVIDVWSIFEDEEGRLVLKWKKQLFGHTAAVAGIMVQAGKVVSGGGDGRVRVWDLEKEEGEGGVPVYKAGSSQEENEGLRPIKVVWFGEDKIVVVDSERGMERVQVMRFD